MVHVWCAFMRVFHCISLSFCLPLLSLSISESVRAVFRLDWTEGPHGSALPRRLLVVTTGGAAVAEQCAAVPGRDDDY